MRGEGIAGRQPYRALIILGLPLIIGLAAYLVVQGRVPASPIMHPHIRGEAYIWPEGCAVRVYRKMAKIAKECSANGYLFSDSFKYKLPHDRGGKYYRINK